MFGSHTPRTLARDVGCGTAALDNFGRGEGTLSPEILAALARELFDAEYDAESDLLKAKPAPDPRPLGLAPPPFDGPQRVYPIGSPPPGPQLVDPPKLQHQNQHRPGWQNK